MNNYTGCSATLYLTISSPVCTLIFSVLVSYSTIDPIRSSLSVLLEEVPPGVKWDEVYDAICTVPGVSNVVSAAITSQRDLNNNFSHLSLIFTRSMTCIFGLFRMDNLY